MGRQKRNRSKLRWIPKGAVIYSDGSWFYRFTEEERDKMLVPTHYYGFPLNGMLGKQIGFGEMVCNAD